MAKTSKRKGGLGRGLDAILPSTIEQKETAAPASSPPEFEKIPIRYIKEINPYQPRTQFDGDELEDLAESIEKHGIIQPITVRKLAEKEYQLIAGERRLRASKMAGLKEIPAYIRTANDTQMLEMALIENIKRTDLNPIEIALSYQRLITELNLKQEELGTKVDKKRSTVTNYLRLLKLPDEIQAGLRDGRISMGHARALISVGDTLKQVGLYREVVEKGYSVRQTEELCKALKTPPPSKEKSEKKQNLNELHLQEVARKLEEKLGNKVRLTQKEKGNGEISIPFANTHDLNRILEILEII